MLEHEITSERRRQSRAATVQLINRKHNAQSYGRDFAALVKLGFLKSREGPGGGVWLTPQGKAEAVRLRTPS
jgi:DNA-binding IscR family transcriptional regulator